MDKEEIILKGGLHARVIEQIAGGPKEHIEKTMELLIKKIKEIPGIKVLSCDTAEAEKNEEWWTTFSELEIIFKKFDDFNTFIYEFMPSSIEIIEPEKLTITNQNLSNVFNDIITRLHDTDMVLKEQSAQKQLIVQSSHTLIRYSLRQALSAGGKTIPELSKLTGIKEEVLPEFLEFFEKDGLLKKEKDKFILKNDKRDKK